MNSRIKFLGHPVHQQLIVFPVGLLATSVIFDIVYLLRGEGRWADIAFWLIGVGVITGLIAAAFGIIDWLAIPWKTRAKRVGMMHAGANGIALIVFLISWFIRYEDPLDPAMTAIALSFVALVLLSFGGWLGGELVDRLGVGVDTGAHLDSPSSLSHEPAATHHARPER